MSSAAKNEIRKKSRTAAMHRALPTSLPSQTSSTKKRRATSPTKHPRRECEPGSIPIRAAVATCDPSTRNLRLEKRLSITVLMASRHPAPLLRTIARGGSLSRVASVSGKILLKIRRRILQMSKEGEILMAAMTQLQESTECDMPKTTRRHLS